MNRLILLFLFALSIPCQACEERKDKNEWVVKKLNPDSISLLKTMKEMYPNRKVSVHNEHGHWYGEAEIPTDSLYDIGYENGWNNAKNFYKSKPKAETVYLELSPATKEWIDYCQREMISMRWYYHTPESLWTAFIKGQIKPCPKPPWWEYILSSLIGLLVGFIFGFTVNPERKLR